jgi:hypothetical protein
LYIESVPEIDVKAARTPEKFFYFRLRNNTTCDVALETDDVTQFVEAIDPNKRPIPLHPSVRSKLNDGELVTRLGRLTSLELGTDYVVTRTTLEGDVRYDLILPGGKSVLFSVPQVDIRNRVMIAVPFEFVWERTAQRPSKGMVGGTTFHLVWFSYSHMEH